MSPRLRLTGATLSLAVLVATGCSDGSATRDRGTAGVVGTDGAGSSSASAGHEDSGDDARGGSSGASDDTGGASESAAGSSADAGGTGSDTGDSEANSGGRGSDTGGSEANSGGRGSDTGGSEANSGGAASSTGGTAGEAGISAGGAQAGGGSGGEGGDSSVFCCMAMPSCDPGDATIYSEDDCPEGATCYSSHMCCTTIWCVPGDVAQCDAMPVCSEGETEVTECPEDASCVSRTLCGTTILCREPSSDECDPDSEYNREYVAESPESCQVIRYTCDEGTTMFSNACGCGCEQPTDCPEYVNCMPTIDPDTEFDTMCTDATECPFTMRAL